MTTASTTLTPPPHVHPPEPQVVRAIAKRSFCTLATVSPAGRPHVAGVLYELVGTSMYVSTTVTSRKARNIAASPHVAVVVPVRRMPVGAPPSTVQFQASATLLAVDDDEIVERVGAGALRSITGHGELDLPDGCFVRIDLPRRLHTYGLGMSLLTLARHPLEAGGVVER
jgi:hypothetical protein